MDKNYTAREWKCDCGFILGLVLRTPQRIRKLFVYRIPKTISPTMNIQAQVMGRMFIVQGLIAADVQCRCGRIRHWEVGEDAMEELMDKCGMLEEYKIKRDKKTN